MKAGYARICINPPYGAPITGYYIPRFVKGIADDLYVRAVAFQDGNKTAIIMALDLCYLCQSEFDSMKAAVTEATGVDADAVFINCSHTHTGPVVGTDFASNLKSPDSYIPFLISCVRDAAVYAVQDLHEAKMESAEGKAERVSFVRRYRMKDGSVATNPGVNNPMIDHALGEPNETVKLVKILRQDADDIAIVNFGTHPDSVGGEYISADYMGHVCSILERAIPNTKCMFLLGAQGDVNHVNVNPTPAESAISVIDFDSVPRSRKLAEHMGRIIAGAVLSIYSITQPIDAQGISYGSMKVELPSYQENHRLDEAKKIHDLYVAGRTDELPYKEMELTTVVAEAERIINLQNGPEFFPFFLSAVKIGQLVFAGIGGEPFTELGNRICADSPYENTILCCLTNSGEGGYIPTRIAYEEGGYEARSSELKPGGDDIIAQGMKELLASL